MPCCKLRTNPNTLADLQDMSVYRLTADEVGIASKSLLELPNYDNITKINGGSLTSDPGETINISICLCYVTSPNEIDSVCDNIIIPISKCPYKFYTRNDQVTVEPFVADAFAFQQGVEVTRVEARFKQPVTIFI